MLCIHGQIKSLAPQKQRTWRLLEQPPVPPYSAFHLAPASCIVHVNMHQWLISTLLSNGARVPLQYRRLFLQTFQDWTVKRKPVVNGKGPTLCVPTWHAHNRLAIAFHTKRGKPWFVFVVIRPEPHEPTPTVSFHCSFAWVTAWE